MPTANSTTSCPRVISPRASDKTLPCSLVMISASSPFFLFRSSRKLKIIAWRLAREVSRHAGNAFVAEAIAALISSWLARATRLVSTPRAGS